VKVTDVVEEVFQIGTRVAYTHQAVSVKRVIGFEAPEDEELPDKRVPQNYGMVERRDSPALRGAAPLTIPVLRPPKRVGYQGLVYELDRWVWVFPRDGEGYVCGLTHRQEGKWDSYPLSWDDPSEGYQNALNESERWPLYEVKKSLTGRAILVPVWAARRA